MASARFALLGVAGFVARRHLEAIHQADGELVAAVDPHDSVGILDRYSLDARFFTREDACGAFLRDLQRAGRGIDYVVVCSPNDLHARHIELGLELGADVICEKPLVTTASDLARISALALERGRSVHPILQLRYHPALVALARELPGRAEPVEVDLDYVTPRGPWYEDSWKGDQARSGGLLANIGVHFLDALLWLFGKPTAPPTVSHAPRTVSGALLLERARVRFRLSIDPAELPPGAGRTLRRLTVLGREVRLEADLDGLHDRAYAAILQGTGLGLEQARPALELCFALARKDPFSEPRRTIS